MIIINAVAKVHILLRISPCLMLTFSKKNLSISFCYVGVIALELIDMRYHPEGKLAQYVKWLSPEMGYRKCLIISSFEM